MNRLCGSLFVLMLASSAARAATAGLYTTEATLGEALFEDKSLSRDRTVACSTCHEASHAFSDGRKVSRGSNGLVGTRNAPSLLSLQTYTAYFWDGRAKTLEEQAIAPFLNRAEMGLSNEAEVVARVQESDVYVRSFGLLGKSATTPLQVSDVVRALVAYERSLQGRPGALEQFLRGDTAALSADAREGLKTFRGKADCAACHRITESGAPLTDPAFHNSSVGLRSIGSRLSAIATAASTMSNTERYECVQRDADCAALGRYVVTLDPQNIGQFRTPSLRAVSQTAPYMHDGSVTTLEEAVDLELYYRGLDLGHPIILSGEEKRNLLAFMREL